MPSTAIDVGGAWGNAGRSLGSVFAAMAQAPLIRQRAEQEAALRAAQTYAANMQGNKHGADARGMEITNNYRTEPVDTSLPQAMQKLQWMWARGGGNVDQMASAQQRLHQMGLSDAAVANPQLAPVIGQAQAAAAGKAIYGNIGNTGAVMNPYTGGMRVANPGMYQLHSTEAMARAQENQAQARAHDAQAALRGRETVGEIIANGVKALNFQRAQQGLPPVQTGAGTGAAEARGRAQIIASIMSDPMIPQEEKESAIGQYMQIYDHFMGGAQAAPVAAPMAQSGQKIISSGDLVERAKKHGIPPDVAANKLRTAGYVIQ